MLSVPSEFVPSSNYPIRSRQHVRWNREADLLRSFEIDRQVDLINRFDRHVLGFNASKDALDILR